jgi:hypothetical protein
MKTKKMRNSCWIQSIKKLVAIQSQIRISCSHSLLSPVKTCLTSIWITSNNMEEILQSLRVQKTCVPSRNMLKQKKRSSFRRFVWMSERPCRCWKTEEEKMKSCVNSHKALWVKYLIRSDCWKKVWSQKPYQRSCRVVVSNSFSNLKRKENMVEGRSELAISDLQQKAARRRTFATWRKPICQQKS